MLWAVTVVLHYDGKVHEDTLYVYEPPRTGNTGGDNARFLRMHTTVFYGV